MIVDNAIGADDLGANSVGSSEIETGSVRSEEVADNSITSEDIYDGQGSNLDADVLDNLDSSAFFILSQNETVTGMPAFNGGTMTGPLDVTTISTVSALRGANDDDTYGYLGAQGQTDFNGVASADWSGHEIGIAGISTGTSTTDNYGVKGHANFVRVRGEYSEDPDTFQGSATYYSYLFTEGDLNRGIRIRNHADAAIKL